MPDSGIIRSTNGCLTCRHRKKKCDETRPICIRCKDGDFECSGYDHLAIPRGPRKRTQKKKVPVADGFDRAPDPSYPILGNTFVTVLPGLLARSRHHQPESHESSTPCFDLNSISKPPQICALDPDHVIQMFIFYSESTPAGVQPFRPVPFSIIHAVADRAKESTIKLKSTYVEARIKKAILDGAGLSLGIRLIDDFQREITSTTLAPDLSTTDVASLLGCLMGLSLGLMHIVNTPMAHSLLRKCVPFFLALAAKFPELWADYLSISIQHVLSHHKFEFSHFAFLDTVTAMLFGSIPLIHYDTTLCPMVQWPREHHIEWAHGCSPVVVVLLAKVNSWRAARSIAPTHPIPAPEERQEFQSFLQLWNPIIEYGDQPVAVMGRLAVQEGWKNAILIYMYMVSYSLYLNCF
ncbi:hypothetical protein B0J17DRAFT_407932 [Rhizoctonia solani]|nr:hypothetical protein B0J17DRAFT_407932 [Rhizoctonia solani]